MYNKFAKGDLIKITNPTPITYPVSANVEMWDNNELRTFENLNRPMRNLFENNQELYSIIKNLQNGLKMGGSSILNGCELVVSESLDEKIYVSLTPGLFFYGDVSYSIYPTPSIASRQLEKDLDIYTEDGINYINITYENGKFSADINISADLSHPTDTVETIPNFDRGIDLLAEIKETLTTAGFTGFKDLHKYTLEPCFEITSDKKFVNFDETTGAINIEDSTATLSFGFVDNFDPTNNESANWKGLIVSAYKDNSVTNAKLDDMEENTLKGNNAVPGDPKDLGKEDVVAMFNLVTMDSPQTIDGTKTFIADQEIKNNKKLTFAPNWSISSNDSNAFVIDESGTSIISIAGNSGAMTIVNPVSLSGTLDVTGATTLANSLTVDASDVDKKISLKGPTTITGETIVKGGNLTIGDTDDDGSTTIKNPVELSNTLAVSGVSTLNNSLIVNASDDDDKKIDLKGPTTITGATKVIGDFTVGNTPDDGSMKVNTPVELSDTLTVSGASTLGTIIGNGPTTITGATTIIGDFTVGNTPDDGSMKVNTPVELSDTLDVTGATTLANSLTVDASDVDKKISLKGPTTITGETIVKGGNLTIGSTPDDGSMTVKNPVELLNTLDVSGVSTLNNSLEVNATEAGKSIDLNGATTITGDTAMTGKLTVTATTTGKSIDFSGPTTITGNFTVDAKASGKSIDLKGPTTITGPTTVIGDFTVGDTPDDGSMTVKNPVELLDTLTVSGASTLNNSLEVDATGTGKSIDLKGPTTITGVTLIKGGLTIGETSSGKTMTVIDPVTLSNTLAVSGVSTLNNSLEVDATGTGKSIDLKGPTTITGDTDMTGKLTIKATAVGKSIDFSGPTTITGNFTVDAKASGKSIDLKGPTTITGVTLIKGGLTIGEISSGKTMTVIDPVALSNTLTVSGVSTLNNSLEVDATGAEELIDLKGPTTITGITKVIGDFTVGDTDDGNITKVNNPVELSDTLDVSGISTLNSSLTVNATKSEESISLSGPTTITGITKVIGDFTIGDTPDDGSMTVNNPVVLNKNLTVEEETTINSSLTVNPTGFEKVSLNGPTETRDFKIEGNLTVDSSDYLKSIKLTGPTNIDGSFVVVSNGDNEEISMTGNTTITSKTGENDFINLSTPNLSTTSKTILLNSTDNTEEDAENRGIVVRGTSDKSFLWNSNNWVSSENINLNTGKTYKINKIDVLSNDTLGAKVIYSSLKKVGTITFGEWRGTTIAVNKGGTGATSYEKGQLLIGKTDGGLGVATITGTANRIIVSNGNGTITLNAPQDIHAEASPTFTGLILTDDLAVNGSAITTAKTTGFSVLNTNLTGVLNFANVATTINMGELANINIGKTTSENKTFKILNTTTSTNSTTGALVVSGGVGIGGAVYTNGALTTAGKITSVGFKSTDTDTDTSLEVATNGVNTTGNVKSTISSDKKFSIEKGGTDGNLLSVKYSGITVGVPIDSSKAITSDKTIKASKFETTNIDTVSAINSKEFNSNTIENTVEPITGSNVSLLWTNSNETEIKRTHFINFPVAVLNGSNGLMPASALSSIKELQEAAGFKEGEGYSNSLLRVVNTKSSTEGDITLYSNDLKLSDISVSHADKVDEETTTIYDMFRDLRTEKVRVKGHLPAGKVNTATFGQIIKKASGTTDVVWGQITDDEIKDTLTKVSPSNSDNLTDDVDREIAFWSTDKKSLIHDTDITYNTSSNTLIAETVSSRSSRKLKKDIELYEKSAFDTIDKIDIVSYHFIADETQTDRVGFIAEDSPELVSGKDRDHMEMNNCIGLLLKAVQELKEENQELRKLINDKNS